MLLTTTVDWTPPALSLSRSMPPSVTTKSRQADGPMAPKKSPLAGLPQNQYTPPEQMTSEQLRQWRKEQRRERNRQSAAASRLQTKQRITQLEAEVRMYQSQYEEMKVQMEGMERQIQMLLNVTTTSSSIPPSSHDYTLSDVSLSNADAILLSSLLLPDDHDGITSSCTATLQSIPIQQSKEDVSFLNFP